MAADNTHDALDRQVPPPASVGLPAHADFDPAAPFWRPSWGDIFARLGWRNVLFLPAVAVVAFLVACAVHPRMLFGFLNVFGVKYAVMALAAPIPLVGWGMRLAVRTRRDPFCIHCGQSLVGLPAEHRCPECGRPYDVRLVADFVRDPAWFVQRWRERYALPPEQGVRVDVPRDAPRRKSRDGT